MCPAIKDAKKADPERSAFEIELQIKEFGDHRCGFGPGGIARGSEIEDTVFVVAFRISGRNVPTEH